MLFPNKVKHRKWHTKRENKNRVRMASRGTYVAFGSYGLKALGTTRMTSNQIEACRRVVRRTLGKAGKLWIRVFPDRPYTKKGAEVPMGKGKGAPEGFVAVVEPGRMLFEVDGVDEVLAREALVKAGGKLGIKTKVVERTHSSH